MRFRNKSTRSIFVIELINCDVDAYPKRLKPRMGCRAAMAYYTLRFLIAPLAKILCEKQAGIFAGAHGERGQRDWKSFRFALVHQDPEFECECVQAAWITIHTDGRIAFTKSRPRLIK